MKKFDDASGVAWPTLWDALVESAAQLSTPTLRCRLFLDQWLGSQLHRQRWRAVTSPGSRPSRSAAFVIDASMNAPADARSGRLALGDTDSVPPECLLGACGTQCSTMATPASCETLALTLSLGDTDFRFPDSTFSACNKRGTHRITPL